MARSSLVRWASIVISLVVVAFGQPAASVPLSLISAACGLALFWYGLDLFESKSARFWLASLFFTAVQLFQLRWMCSDTYQGIYTYFFWLILCTLCGLQFGLLSYFVGKRGSLLFIPAFWTLMEYLRLYFSEGFTFNLFGLTLTASTLSFQMVSLFGIYGLTFWAMLTNTLLYTYIKERRHGKQLVAVLLFPYLFGAIHLVYHAPKLEQSVPLHALLLQTGLTPGQASLKKMSQETPVHPFEQWRSLFNLCRPYQGMPFDLILAPETSAPFTAGAAVYDLRGVEEIFHSTFGPQFRPSPQLERLVGDFNGIAVVSNTYLGQSLAEAMGTTVVMGMDDHDESKGKNYSRALFFKGGERGVERYAKQILLPIVEKLPMEAVMRPIAARYGINAWFTEGEGPVVVEGSLPMAATICYEELFPSVSREARLAGAHLFLNLSTDGWYPHSDLPMQHFTQGRVRAVENGVPLLRSCSTGVTAAVDALGRTVALLEPTEPAQTAALEVSVSSYSYPTLYTRLGDGPVLAASCMVIALYLLSPVYVRRKSRARALADAAAPSL